MIFDDVKLGGNMRRNTVLGVFKKRSLSRASRNTRLALLLCPALVAIGCGPGEDPDALECGEGTEDRNGTCVAIVDAVSSCGDGTIFDETTGKCEPTIRCGAGTEPHESGECVPIAHCGPGTELDLGTGECIPVAECGPGTVLDESTGECRSAATCGAGTVLEDGACVAVGTCGAGSVLNMDTGLCESNTACGPGQVVASGQCVDPNVAVGLEADAFESTPDQNDPRYGGVPEALELEPVGEQTVFVGNIARPADLSGNGTLDQDRDVWGFSGTAGQYLEISVLGTGLPQPAFILEGPRGYRRVSPLLSTNDTSREVVLPYDGDYELIVVPTAFVSTELPLGSTNSGYVGVIEQLEQPTPTTVVPSSDPAAPYELTGNLRDLSDNFLLLDADVGDAVSLVFHEPNAKNPPAILAFDASGALITHVDLDLSQGAWVGTLVKEDPGTTVVVDWQSSTGANDAYTLHIAEVPHLQGGTVPANGRGSTGSTSILGHSMAAFTVAVPSPLILFWDIERTFNPDLQLQNDDGTYAIVYDDHESFFFAEPSTYTFFVFNDDTSEDSDAFLLYETVTPYDFGELDPTNPETAKVAGHLLSPDFFGPSSAWMVARTTAPSLLRFETSVELGNPKIVMYDLAGAQLHSHHAPRYGLPLHAVTDGSPVLVQLDAGTVSTLGWEVAATALPPAPDLDVEPNDVGSTSVDLGALPASTVGRLGDTEIDMYQLTLDEPLSAGQAIRVHVENLESTGFGFTSGAMYVRVYDELNQQVPTTDLYFQNNNLQVYILPSDTQSSSTFYVELEESFFSGEQQYLLSVEVVDQATEVEPNDTKENADVADGLPVTWAGHWSATDDDPLDWFSFSVDEDLGLNDLLRVRFLNLSSSNPTTLTVEDAEGNVVGTQTASSGTSGDAELLLPLLPAGEYYVSVAGPIYAVAYTLTVELIPVPPTEIENNNTADVASSLGELAAAPLYAFGYTSSNDADWFSFTLPAALEDDEGLRVRCLNLGDFTALECELFDLTDVNAPVRLAYAREDEGAFMVSGGASTTFGVRMSGTLSSTDFYYVQVELGGAAEHEPNNSAADAQPLGELAPGEVLTEMGNVHTTDEDWFSFTLEPGFPDDESIWVTWDNIVDFSNLDVELYDVTEPGSPVRLSYMRDDVGIIVSGPTGGSTYAVRVVGTLSTANDLYQLWVETGPRAEVEPNDDGAGANALGALPATIYGVISNGTADVFTFDLDADLGESEVVEIYFRNLSDGTGYDVNLRPAGDTSRPQQLDDDEGTVWSDPGLAAGSYEIQIDGLDSASFSMLSDLYLIEVRVVDTAITP